VLSFLPQYFSQAVAMRFAAARVFKWCIAATAAQHLQDGIKKVLITQI